jgi:hypothetical protein
VSVVGSAVALVLRDPCNCHVEGFPSNIGKDRDRQSGNVTWTESTTSIVMVLAGKAAS